MNSVDAAGLAAVISPLRRNLLSSARQAARLPDIPDAQIEVIRALPANASVTSGELAERLGLNASTVSNLLRAMSAAGLVDRRRSEQDARRIDVRLTPKATRLFERFDDAAAHIVKSAASTLSPEHRRALAQAQDALEALSAAIADARRDTSHNPNRKEAE